MAEDNGAWLGLLKWSLAYSDGTVPSEESMQPMSEEKRKFLEAVMKDGIIDEGKRMRAILAELTLILEPLFAKNKNSDSPEALAEAIEKLNVDEISELMLELQDIVEQIDYARDFMKMGGIPFLLGCANERSLIPSSIRADSLSILATMAQNNPPVQEALLVVEDGLSTLGKLFFEESQTQEEDIQGIMRSRILRAISCAIRGHIVGEESFCRNAHLRSILDLGLGAVAMVPAGSSANVSDEEMATRKPPLALRKKSLFLLRALVTSDTSTRQRVRDFSTSLNKVIDNVLAETKEDEDLFETSLATLLSVLRQKKSVNIILDEKNHLVAKGVSRVAEIRRMPEGDDKEYAKTESDLWESIIVELARCERDSEEQDATEAPILLANSPANPSADSLPQ